MLIPWEASEEMTNFTLPESWTSTLMSKSTLGRDISSVAISLPLGRELNVKGTERWLKVLVAG